MSIQHAISQLSALITKIEDHTGTSAIQVPKQQKQSKIVSPKIELPPLITAFSKCEIRVSQIVECTRVDYSDKLLVCKLKVSETEIRDFAAGVGPWYSPEELLNKKIVTILNLKARPMAEGRIISQAMLFAGSSADHSVVKLCFPDQSIPVGTRVLPEGYTELPEAEGQPKKNFDKVLDVLKSKNREMTMDGVRLLANGKSISVNVEDGFSLG
ncbi:Methionyl-tRNA synthetase [Spironucleus salmonicida]|uniref:Methionyl-tRNA synthetase n=1 Tax=Spironucleus salmonicida TaxID=348837 RepID=V6LDC5_9EUKA|nr:Methionyl-tRNA synthetase [Spironucleus salmonicida]|eukprot:EST42510.1 Methionyl-tRNA synthetase [Spironucleus salmonicida]